MDLMEEKFSLASAPRKPFFAAKNLFSVVGLLILLLGFPLTTYLTLNQTNFLPQAAKTNNPESPQAGFLLETAKPTAFSGSSLVVSVIARSDLDEANLFVAKIKYPANLLSVEKIEADNLKVESEEEILPVRFLETKFDNSKGELSLVGTAANPGFKTASSQKKYILAKVYFKTKIAGIANLTFDESSAIFRNTDNSNILQTRQALAINIVGGQMVSTIATPSATESTSSANNLVVLSPNGGEVYEYSSPIEVKWLGEDVKDISIGLLLNDIFLGTVANNLPNNGLYLWNPSETIPLSFVTPYNTYQIRISSQIAGKVVMDKSEGRPSSHSKEIVDESNGPFGLVLKKQNGLISTPSSQEDEVSSIEQSADFSSDGKTNFTDLSMLMSKYNKILDSKDKKFDLNKDGGVNDIDLWYLMNFLVKNNVIRDK